MRIDKRIRITTATVWAAGCLMAAEGVPLGRAERYQPNSSPSAQGNRIFLRTRGMLWCIGDPSQKFPTDSAQPPQG